MTSKSDISSCSHLVNSLYVTISLRSISSSSQGLAAHAAVLRPASALRGAPRCRGGPAAVACCAPRRPRMSRRPYKWWWSSGCGMCRRPTRPFSRCLAWCGAGTRRSGTRRWRPSIACTWRIGRRKRRRRPSWGSTRPAGAGEEVTYKIF